MYYLFFLFSFTGEAGTKCSPRSFFLNWKDDLTRGQLTGWFKVTGNSLLCCIMFYLLAKLRRLILWYLLVGPERHILKPYVINLILSPPSVTLVREHTHFASNESLLSHHTGFAETHLWPLFPQWSDCGGTCPKFERCRTVGFFTWLIHMNYENRNKVSCMSSHVRRLRQLVYSMFVVEPGRERKH